VHGASRDALRFVRTILETEINSVTDNPLIFPVEKKILSGGNFHGQYVSMAMDFLSIAVAELASISEQRIEKLIIEDIGPEAQPENYLHFQKLLGQVPAPFRSREEAKHFLFGEFVKNFQGHEDPRVMADYFYANMTETSEGTVSWRFSPEAIVATAREGRMQDYWGLVENLSVPTLWIRGENSVELPKAVYERVLAMNSRIMGHVIQDAAHWVHADQPEAFIKIIKEFVGVPSNISYKAPKE
jgi:pimeloyl-ACP methyl ester carboxylesterase